MLVASIYGTSVREISHADRELPTRSCFVVLVRGNVEVRG